MARIFVSFVEFCQRERKGWRRTGNAREFAREHDHRCFQLFFLLCICLALVMFSHVVIFWTDPQQPGAADELIAGANQYLKSIPGVLQFHIGKMVPSHRPVVDQSYQVAINILFPTKQAQDEYQTHPRHVEFVERVFKRVCVKVVVYDFE